MPRVRVAEQRELLVAIGTGSLELPAPEISVTIIADPNPVLAPDLGNLHYEGAHVTRTHEGADWPATMNPNANSTFCRPCFSLCWAEPLFVRIATC